MPVVMLVFSRRATDALVLMDRPGVEELPMGFMRLWMTLLVEVLGGEIEDISMGVPLFAPNTTKVMFSNGPRGEWKGTPSQFPLWPEGGSMVESMPRPARWEPLLMTGFRDMLPREDKLNRIDDRIQQQSDEQTSLQGQQRCEQMKKDGEARRSKLGMVKEGREERKEEKRREREKKWV